MTNNKKTTVAPDIDLSKKEIADAKHEGAIDAIKEGAKHSVEIDSGTTGDAEALADAERLRVAPNLESTILAPLLDLPLETLTKRISNDKLADFIGFEDVKGLLHLERSGKNRDLYVMAFCAALGIKDPREVTPAGPGYMNKVADVTHLGER